jgi:TPP-dependent pyruvate/acetoin dehydrogenase alpha subunit
VLVEAGVERARLDAVRSEAQRTVAEALQRAKGWPDPEPEARFEHVFVAGGPALAAAGARVPA